MPQSLGTFIRERRQDLGLTQEELADRIGGSVRQAEISRLEGNRIALPRRDRLEAIANALDVSLGELLVRSGWMTNGDRLAAAVLNVEALASRDLLFPQSVADLADIVADVQAMVADATRTVEAAALALAHAQAKLATLLEAGSGKVIPSNGHLALPNGTDPTPHQTGDHAGTGSD
jgi:transcriptional regulator with XRE-family HTH domain